MILLFELIANVRSGCRDPEEAFGPQKFQLQIENWQMSKGLKKAAKELVTSDWRHRAA